MNASHNDDEEKEQNEEDDERMKEWKVSETVNMFMLVLWMMIEDEN